MANLPDHPRCPHCGSYSTERHWSDKLLQFGAGVIGGIANAVVEDKIGVSAYDDTVALYANKIVNEFSQKYICNKCSTSFDLTKNNVVSNDVNLVSHANLNPFVHQDIDRRISIKGKELNSKKGLSETDIICTVQQFAFKFGKKSQRDFSRNEIVKLSKKLGLDTDVLHSRIDFYLNAETAVTEKNEEPTPSKLILNNKSNNTFSYVKSSHSFEKLAEKSIDEFNNRLFNLLETYENIGNIPKRILSDLGKSCGLTLSEVRNIVNEKDNQKEDRNKVKDNFENADISNDAIAMIQSNTANEQIYIDEFIQYLNDGEISLNNKRILNRLAKSLNITESRVIQLENSCLASKLSETEKEYFEELKACFENGTEIGDSTKRLLNRLADSLGIPEKRQKEIYQYLKLKYYATL